MLKSGYGVFGSLALSSSELMATWCGALGAGDNPVSTLIVFILQNILLGPSKCWGDQANQVVFYPRFKYITSS